MRITKRRFDELQGEQVIDTEKPIASILPGQFFVPGAGKVYDLTSPGDLPGTYGAIQTTFAIAGGATDMTMKNQNGVTVVILKTAAKRQAPN